MTKDKAWGVVGGVLMTGAIVIVGYVEVNGIDMTEGCKALVFWKQYCVAMLLMLGAAYSFFGRELWR